MDPATSYKAPPRRPQHASPSGCVLAAFSLLLIVGAVHGTLAFGCYLVNEHRRLVWPEIVVIWLGDSIALFWFVRYAVRWFMGRYAVDSERLQSRKMPRSVWVMMISMTVGLLAELGMTLMLRHDEFVAFGRAVPAVCNLTGVRAQTAKGAAASWKLDGQYVDAAGQSHLVTYYVGARDELPKLPPGVQQGIRRRQPRLQLPIVYDPQRPGRSWIAELGWDDGNRLHYLSLAVLLFQFMFTLLFVAFLRESIKTYRRIPWWTELHNLLPLGCAAFFMALFGGLELYVVRHFCP